MPKIQHAFLHRLGRARFFSKCIDVLVFRQLESLGRRHLREGRRQVAIFAFDHIGHCISVNGVYEGELLNAFFAWLERLEVETGGYDAVDVGANIGNHSLYFADRFRTVVSFEPNPRVFPLLALNASLVTNVRCHPCGLSDQATTASLIAEPSNLGAAHIVQAGATGLPAIELRTLDEIDGLNRVRLVKIDVEGLEEAVIRGGGRLLRTAKPIVIVEQRPQDFRDGRSATIETLRGLGYDRFALIEPYPRPPNWLGRSLIGPLRRAIFGDSVRIHVTKHPRAGFHHMLAALPDWFPDRQPTRSEALLTENGPEHGRGPSAGTTSRR